MAFRDRGRHTPQLRLGQQREVTEALEGIRRREDVAARVAIVEAATRNDRFEKPPDLRAQDPFVDTGPGPEKTAPASPAADRAKEPRVGPWRPEAQHDIAPRGLPRSCCERE